MAMVIFVESSGTSINGTIDTGQEYRSLEDKGGLNSGQESKKWG